VAQDEQVLVVERKVLEQVGVFHGLTTDVDHYLSFLKFIEESPESGTPYGRPPQSFAGSCANISELLFIWQRGAVALP